MSETTDEPPLRRQPGLSRSGAGASGDHQAVEQRHPESGEGDEHAGRDQNSGSPPAPVLGLTSYARLAGLAVHDAHYARGIGRIRAFYFTLDPSAHQYWLLTPGDDLHALVRQAGQQHSRWHHFSHTATSVAAVTSMIAGVFAGLVASRLGASSLTVLGVLATVVAGGMFAGLFADQERRWRRSGESEPTLFLPDGQPVVQVRGLVSAPTTATSAATQVTA